MHTLIFSQMTLTTAIAPPTAGAIRIIPMNPCALPLVLPSLGSRGLSFPFIVLSYPGSITARVYLQVRAEAAGQSVDVAFDSLEFRAINTKCGWGSVARTSRLNK